MPLVWKVHAAGAPAVQAPSETRPLLSFEVAIEVAGCLLEPRDARTAAGGDPEVRFPLVPGRHASGRVVATGAEATSLLGQPVLVPELHPCGTCAACRRALAVACPTLIQPGVRHDGGLADRLVVPARYVLPLQGALAWERPLCDAAAIGRFALPYQALAMAGIGAGDVAVGFEDDALAALLRAKAARAPTPDAPVGWHLFVRDGAPIPGDALRPGVTLVVYGTPPPPEGWPVPALAHAEATVRFVRACHPDLYPELLALAIRGEIDIGLPDPLPMSRGDEALARCATGPVLVVRD